MWSPVFAAMVSWHQVKLFIEYTVSLDHDALHVIVGLLLWLVLALLTRRPLASWVPWLLLLVVILWSESVDLWTERWPDPGQQYGEGAKDLLITMLVPGVLMVAVRRRPDLFRAHPRSRRIKRPREGRTS
jgi:hypothetical protein